MLKIGKSVDIKYIKLSCTECTPINSRNVGSSCLPLLLLQVDGHPPQASSPSAEAGGADQEDSQLSSGCLASVLTH